MARISKGMMFFNENLADAFAIANKFGNGRVATLPDVVDARLRADKNEPVWTQYVVTTTAEYIGKSRAGNPLLITAHGIGPLADWSDHTNRRAVHCRGWAPDLVEVSKEEFLKLESGGYGDVSVTELSGLNPHYEAVHAHSAMQDPRIVAALGPRAHEYAQRHKDIAAAEQGNTFIFDVDSHKYANIDRFIANEGIEGPFYGGSLLTVGQLVNTHHTVRRKNYVSPTSSLHAGFIDGAARMIGIRGEGRLGIVNAGIDAVINRLKAEGKPLMIPAQIPPHGFYEISERNGQFFGVLSQYGGVAREDDALTVRVLEMEQIPGPDSFKTTVPAYHGWIKYATSEVQKIAPPAANAYQTGEFKIIWEGNSPTWHEAPISFYKVQVDRTQRLMEPSDARDDLSLVLTTAGIVV